MTNGIKVIGNVKLSMSTLKNCIDKFFVEEGIESICSINEVNSGYSVFFYSYIYYIYINYIYIYYID